MHVLLTLEGIRISSYCGVSSHKVVLDHPWSGLRLDM